MALHLDDRLAAAPHVLYQDVDGEGVLLDLESETYFGLNETAARLWTLLSESCSVRRALERMAEEYDVSADDLESDARGILDEWLARGLARVVRD